MCNSKNITNANSLNIVRNVLVWFPFTFQCNADAYKMFSISNKQISVGDLTETVPFLVNPFNKYESEK